MTCTFAYCRVSKADQTTDNQVHEIAAAGFKVDGKRVVAETVSGSVATPERNPTGIRTSSRAEVCS